MLLGSWAKEQDAQTHTLTLARQLMSTGKHSKTACSLHNTRSSDPVSNVQRIITLSFSSDLLLLADMKPCGQEGTACGMVGDSTPEQQLLAVLIEMGLELIDPLLSQGENKKKTL